MVLDESFKQEGIKIGDKIKDSASEITLTVVGFTKEAKYGHSSIGFISKDTYVAMREANQPNYKWLPQAYVTSSKPSNSSLPSGLKAYQKQAIIEKIPGYQAEHLTLTMITWVLLLASAAILGVFFYILTLQKLHQNQPICIYQGKAKGLIGYIDQSKTPFTTAWLSVYQFEGESNVEIGQQGNMISTSQAECESID